MIYIRKLFALLLVVLLTGSQWAILQGIAWTGMIISYTQQENIAAGIEKTFDGDHPCSMCRAIDKAKTSPADEQQNGAIQTPPAGRMEALVVESISLRLPDYRTIRKTNADDLQPDSCKLKPPVPPPRHLSA